MGAKTRYEQLALDEIRKMPGEILPQVIKILRSLHAGVDAVTRRKRAEIAESGLCGIWKDSRSADELVEDIYSHRTGFGGRKVEL